MLRNKILVLLLTIILTTIYAEEPKPNDVLIIDLAELATAKEQLIKIKSNVEYQIKIINRLPNTNYPESVEIEEGTIAPLSISSLGQESDDTKDGVIRAKDVDSDCQILNNLIAELNGAETEKKINEIVSKYRNNISSCPELIEEYIVNTTQKLLNYKYSLTQGEKLKITITREKKGTETENKNWVITFYTPGEGKWFTSYGFSFIPTFLSKNEEFFSEESDSAFIIKKGTNNKKLIYVPSIFFTWMPYNKTSSYGLTAGLGFDLQDPVIFAGLSYTYKYNLSFIVGATAHKVDKLISKYEENQVIPGALDSTELKEEVYRVNFFLSVAFRFGANPFSL